MAQPGTDTPVSNGSPQSAGTEAAPAKRPTGHPLLRLARSAGIYLGLLLLVGLGLAGAEWIAHAAGLKSGHTQFLRIALLGVYALAAIALIGRRKK